MSFRICQTLLGGVNELAGEAVKKLNNPTFVEKLNGTAMGDASGIWR